MPIAEGQLVTPLPHTVVNADCIEYLSSYRGKPFDLVFADPPFNIGVEYDGDDTSDSMTQQEYEDFTQDWCSLVWKNLSPDGVAVFYGPDSLIDIYLPHLNTLFMRRLNWIIWHYRFAQCHRASFLSSKCHALVYAKGLEHTWNPDAVKVQSDRAAVYNDERINETANGGMRVPFDVWGIPSDGPHWGRVQGNATERRPLHKNQLPEKLLTRFILAYTNPGDLVYDPFGGSGTTIAVAKKLGRSAIVTERSSAYCRSILERLSEI